MSRRRRIMRIWAAFLPAIGSRYPSVMAAARYLVWTHRSDPSISVSGAFSDVN